MIDETRILGCLIGAAAGDAMGAATECRTTGQIREYFGDYVTEFRDAPNDTFAQGATAGMVTDDFWQGYYILNAALAEQGSLTEQVVKNGFARWIDNPWYENFTGPTTRQTMTAIFNDDRPSFQGALESKTPARLIINDGNAKATNGGAMKIFPAALLSPGDFSRIVDNAVTMTVFTHKNSLSVSGACAVAAAIGEALISGADDVQKVIDAGISGAVKGFDIMEKRGFTVAGPSVTERIKLAVSIGSRYTDWKKAIVELADLIGNGLHVSEAVPAAFGILAIKTDNPLEHIYAGVNIGNDTDTIAIMVGSVIGALYGAEAFPDDYLKLIDQKNQFDLRATARDVARVICS